MLCGSVVTVCTSVLKTWAYFTVIIRVLCQGWHQNILCVVSASELQIVMEECDFV